MHEKETFNIRTLAVIGVMSALVFALSLLSVQVTDFVRLHFGNIMCLLSGMLFGPLVGGLSSGIGSMLYDFTNPLYTPEFWITFIMKFALGFTAGMVTKKLQHRLPGAGHYALAAGAGSVVYLALFLTKTAVMQYFVYGLPWDAVLLKVGVSAATSSVNAVVAVIASTLLAPVLRKALDKAGLARTAGIR